MKCPSCGFENEAGVHFCGDCGAKIPEESPQTSSGKLVCPNCGLENPSDARFCQNCGQIVGVEQKRVVTPQPIPQIPPPIPVVKKGMPGWVWAATALLVIIIGGSGFLIFRKPSSSAVIPNVTKTPQPVAASPVSQPTISVLPTVDEGILLYDNFDDKNSGWPVFSDEKGEVGYLNGNFQIAFYKPMGFHSAWSSSDYSDFVAETLFSVAEGVPDLGGGLTFRAKDKNWYLVWVYPTQGKYIFIKSVNEQATVLIPLTASNVIQPARKDGRLYLQLKVEARGDKFNIWIGQPSLAYKFLTSVRDADLKTGRLGPSADCPDSSFNSPMEVLFEWIKISK